MKTKDVEQTIQTLQDKLTQEKSWNAAAEQQLAAIKRDMGRTLEDATVRAIHKMADDPSVEEMYKQSQELAQAYENGWNAAIAQSDQEPVAWRYRMPVEDGHWVWNYATYIDDPKDQRCEPLYTAPPQRTWVGLTDKEYQELHLEMGPVYFYQDYARAIEDKLRSKNT